MDPLKLVMAQLNFRIGDFRNNAASIINVIKNHPGADLVVFSELAISGYYPQDMIDRPSFLGDQDEALGRIVDATRGLKSSVALGAVTRNNGVGKAFHNSLLLIQNGKVVRQYNKQLLPTYNVFDERRHFEPGPDTAAVADVAGYRVGFLICEDGWNDLERDYPVNPFRTLAQAGADLVVSINASPSDIGKQQQRHRLFSVSSGRHNLPLVYVNQVGGNDELVFDGGSFVVEPGRGAVHQLAMFEEDVATLVFDGKFSIMNGIRPDVSYLSDMEFYYRQIVLGLRDYLKKTGFKGVVVGSSGGIDSALTLALATDALGAENVKAITMPSGYSSKGSVIDSGRLCENLGVELFDHGIAAPFDQMTVGFQQAFGAFPSSLTRENLQARIRGIILMAFSNHFGHLVLSTGNKSEMSVGYSTLYGDMNGGLNLIGDLYKTEVFALARYYNQLHGAEIIPEAIINKEPSAELSDGQKDSDSLPPYPVLDQILKLLIEGRQLRPEEYSEASSFVADLKKSGSDLVDKVESMIARAEFKRRQAPPIIRCRARAFGNGWQMPIAARY